MKLSKTVTAWHYCIRRTVMFPCDKCGECCRHIDVSGGLIPAEFDAGGGVCRHLTTDGLCATYDHRPEVCNVDRYYENHLTGVMSREEWYEKNMSVCAILKGEGGHM